MNRLLLDEIARFAARKPGPDVVASGQPFTRAVAVKRGLIGTLTFAGLGRLAFPERSSGAGCPGGSLQACLDRGDKLYRDLLNDCDEIGDFPRKLLCYRVVNSNDRKRLQNVCRKSCPSPPKPPRGSKPTRPKSPPQPPALPPNPYDSMVAECANCIKVSAAAVCCWGKKDPRRMCGCGNKDLGPAKQCLCVE